MKSSWRLHALLLLFILLGSLVVAKLFYWQVIKSDQLKVIAKSQYFHQEEIPAKRGQIISSDDFPLAGSKPLYLLYTETKQLSQDINEISSKLAEILQPEDFISKRNELREKLSVKEAVWLPMARDLNQKQKKEIEKLQIKGLGFEEIDKRYYPEGSMSAHLLGFVGQDTSGRFKGYFGLEGFYERSLAGQSGYFLGEKDASGKPILIGKFEKSMQISGKDIKLYLDRAVQFIVERKLREGILKYQAKSGTIIIMDPKTGGILAMASFPDYDPNFYWSSDKNLFPNPAVAKSFEPGSIFKVLVMSAAIDSRVIKAEDKCSCEGPRTIGEYTIRTWNDKYYPGSTMIDIIAHSDNIGMVYVGEKLGKDKLLDYLKKFGIGSMTGIDLEDETSIPLKSERELSPIDLATLSFGQGVAVTPIQIVSAVSAIANGGKLVEPHVVSKIIGEDKEININPKVIRDVISPQTAKIITEMMVNAVDQGEAKWTKLSNYRIAGKTGTAQIPIKGHYDKEKTNASFIGFAPADSPKFVMLVTLQEPSSSPWAAETAAPLWFDLAKELFVHLRLVQ